MAKKVSKRTKLFLSILFHLIVLVIMVNAYDNARALYADFMKNRGSETSAKSKDKSSGKKGDDKKVKKQGTIEPIGGAKPTGIIQPTGSQIKSKLNETENKLEERGTSMEDLLDQKRKKDAEKAAQQNPQ